MNTYHKFAPNVFIAKCEERYEKGEIIIVETKYGKENEEVVFNLIREKDGYFYYSIVRADGFNTQEWAKRRAERYQSVAINAAKKSEERFNAANRHNNFLSMGEPIKIGHHSERAHRKLFEDVDRNMGKVVSYNDKAEEYARKARYYEDKMDTINLSMPESIDFYAFKLAQAKEKHEGLKSGKYPRLHAYSLTYAKKAVNDMEKNHKLAIQLWGE